MEVFATSLFSEDALRFVLLGTATGAIRATYPTWVVALAVTVAEIALGIVLIARPGGDVNGAALTVGAIAALEGALELEAVIARHHRDRALGRIARKVTAGSPVDPTPKGMQAGTRL